MNMDQAELQEEKYYLQKVIHFADQRLDALQNRKLLLQKEIAAQTEVMREELTQIIRDFDDIMQLSMENAVLTDVQKQYAESDKEYHRIQNLKASPYFARIDFVDHEFGDENKIYIGTSGLSDSTSHQIYVCDWRAPVCELFYGFDTGEACYKTTAGKIDVTLLKKRQYKIVCGKIQGMYDSNASLYDEILGEALSGLTGPKLKVIVDSIQKEQNCAIRFIKNPHVLIFGPAGSGKTSVGMHRLAYMLYAQKDRLKAQDIVILSNNQIFSSYIAGILPQLCEEEVSRMVFHELLDSLLPLHIACEDFYSQYRAIEDMGFDGQECENRRERISLKYSVEMLKFIETYFKEYSFDLPDIQYKDDILISAQELNERIRRQLSDYSGKGMAATYHQRLELLLELVRKTYDNYFLDHQDQIRETIAAEVLDELGDEPEGTDLKLRYRWHRKQVIADTLETIRTRNQLNTYAHLLKILELYSKEKGLSEPMSVLVREDWDRGKLCFEDALLYVIIGLLPARSNHFPMSCMC